MANTPREDAARQSVRASLGVPADDLPAANLVGFVVARQPVAAPADTPAREFLATALGVDVAKLSALDDAEIDHAVSQLHNLASRFRDLTAEASVDELTGALRRGPGMAALQREIDRNKRAPAEIAVVFIDADGLKVINDNLGHAAGDEFLRAIVGCLRDRLRSYDVIVRYGGDEFFCILTNVSVPDAQHLMRDIQEAIRQRTGGKSVSVGVTDVTIGDTADSVVARADYELYESRRRSLVTSRD